MKHLVVTALILLFCAANALAQETPEQKALIHKGTVKIWTGMVLVGVGAVLGPATAATENPTTGKTVGFVTVMSGATVMAWGYHDRYKAYHPATTVGVTVGKTTGVQIRRTW
jgi:hypothetical protein